MFWVGGDSSAMIFVGDVEGEISSQLVDELHQVEVAEWLMWLLSWTILEWEVMGSNLQWYIYIYTYTYITVYIYTYMWIYIYIHICNLRCHKTWPKNPRTNQKEVSFAVHHGLLWYLWDIVPTPLIAVKNTGLVSTHGDIFLRYYWRCPSARYVGL